MRRLILILLAAACPSGKCSCNHLGGVCMSCGCGCTSRDGHTCPCCKASDR